MKSITEFTKSISLLLSLVAMLSNCKQKETEILSTDICASLSPFVREINQEVGIVYYDSTQAKYGLQVPTSIDSADMGLACNLPSAYQQVMKKVRFSGRYYESNTTQTGPVGYRYYNLIITSISSL